MEVTVDPTRILEARTRVVTQILTRPTTTITTVVTLGDGPPFTAISTSTPPPETTTSTPIPPATSPGGSLTPEQLGALLGSVLGLAFLALLICCAISFHRRRRRRREQAMYYYDDSLSESEVIQAEAAALRSNPAWNLHRHNMGVGVATAAGTWTTVPPPVRFPPTPRRTGTPYSQTREAQIRGVRRYP